MSDDDIKTPEPTDGSPEDSGTAPGAEGRPESPEGSQTPSEPATAPVPDAPKPAAPAPKRPEISSLPKWAQDLIAGTRDEAARTRVEAKKAAAKEATDELVQNIGKALGLVKDEKGEEQPLTAEQLQEMLTSERQSTRSAQTELAVFRALSDGEIEGVNANALFDSSSFKQSLADIDPSDTKAIKEAIGAAVAASPWLKTAPPAPAAPADPEPKASAPTATKTGASFAGGPSNGRDDRDLSTMTIDELRAYQRGGR